MIRILNTINAGTGPIFSDANMYIAIEMFEVGKMETSPVIKHNKEINTNMAVKGLSLASRSMVTKQSVHQ